MSLTEDYKEIISNNRKYVIVNFPKYFNEYYLSYKIKLAKNIVLNVFDEQDHLEVKGYLKELYRKTLTETVYSPHGELKGFLFDWLSLHNGLIEIDELKMLESSKSIWNTYDKLDKVLGSVTPFTYSIFMDHCRFTIRIKAIKEFANHIKREPKDNHGLFKNDGFNLFKYLEKNFDYDKGITVKYTIIYEFLETKKKIINNFDQYRIFILEKRSEDLRGLKFARRADTSGKDISVLTELYRDFNKIH